MRSYKKFLARCVGQTKISSHILPIPPQGPTVPILKSKAFHWVWRQKLPTSLSPNYTKHTCLSFHALSSSSAVWHCQTHLLEFQSHSWKWVDHTVFECQIAQILCYCHLKPPSCSVSPQEKFRLCLVARRACWSSGLDSSESQALWSIKDWLMRYKRLLHTTRSQNSIIITWSCLNFTPVSSQESAESL